jgi:hypothetical protein
MMPCKFWPVLSPFRSCVSSLQALIDDRAELRDIAEHLARRLHPVSDDLGGGGHQLELDIGTRLGIALRHHAGAVGEARLLDVLQRVAVHLALREQVTDRKAALRQRQDTRKPRGVDGVPHGAGGVGGKAGECRLGLHVDATARVGLAHEFLDLGVLGEDLAHGLGLRRLAAAVFEHLLLERRELLGERRVHFGEGFVDIGLERLDDLVALGALADELFELLAQGVDGFLDCLLLFGLEFGRELGRRFVVIGRIEHGKRAKEQIARRTKELVRRRVVGARQQCCSGRRRDELGHRRSFQR